MELLKKYVKQPLKVNQLQLSLEQSQFIDQGLYMNNKTTDMSLMRDGGALDYFRLNDSTISRQDAGYRRNHEPGSLDRNV